MKTHFFQSIRGRLLLLFLISSFGILLVGGLGLIGSQVTYKSLEQVYTERVIPLRLLKVVSEGYASQIPDATTRMNNGEVTGWEGIAMVRAAQDSIQSCWNQYRTLPKNPEEARTAAHVEILMQSANQEISGLLDLLQALNSQSGGLLSNQLGMLEGSLRPAIRPVVLELDSLTNMQLELAHQEYIAASSRFNRNLVLAIILVALTALGIGILGLKILQQVHSQLAEILPVLTRLGEGDLSAEVSSTSDDELGAVAKVTNEMIYSLRSIVVHITHGSAKLASASLEFGAISDQVAANSSETSHQSTMAAAAAEQASISTSVIAKSMEHISESIESLATIIHDVHESVAVIAESAQDDARLAFNAHQQALAAQIQIQELLQIRSSSYSSEQWITLKVATQMTKEYVEQIAVAAERMHTTSHSIALNAGNLNLTLGQSETNVEVARDAIQRIARNISESAQGLTEIAQTAQHVQRSAAQTSLGIAQFRQNAQALYHISTKLATLVQRFRI